MALILDTGPLYASMDRRDPDHHSCRTLIDEARDRLVVPAPVIPELDYFVRQRLGVGPMLAFLQDIADGAYEVEDLVPTDYVRIAEMIDRYADQDLGFVDSAIVAVAERFDELRVATLDRRHFSVVRPRHGDAFEIVP